MTLSPPSRPPRISDAAHALSTMPCFAFSFGWQLTELTPHLIATAHILAQQNGVLRTIQSIFIFSFGKPTKVTNFCPNLVCNGNLAKHAATMHAPILSSSIQTASHLESSDMYTHCFILKHSHSIYISLVPYIQNKLQNKCIQVLTSLHIKSSMPIAMRFLLHSKNNAHYR